ncbi:MAG: metallophosphoesterase [bacterium]|nr:metallophosphoesterase [bacterium]
MLLGVISDTHENMDKIAQAVKIFNEYKVEAVFHCGDWISPITSDYFKDLECRLFGVFGNNDGDKNYLLKRYAGIAEIYPSPHKFQFNNLNILVMHEPDFLDEFIESGKFNIILYGHTHDIDIRKTEKTLICNPGEAGGWLRKRFSIGIIDTVKSDVEILDI